MTSLAAQLEIIDRQVADALAVDAMAGRVSDGELVATLQTLGRIQRRIDGAIVESTDRVVERDQGGRATRLSTRAGCRDAGELLRRALRVDVYTARRFVSAATAVHREVDITSGEMLPGPFPELSAALTDGELSLTGFLACTVPLQKAAGIGVMDRLAADTVLARFARGVPLDGAPSDGVDAGDEERGERAPAPSTDELAGLTAHIIARLDPDGAEPKDRASKRRRHFTIGRLREGTVPVRGELLPEVAAQLEKLVDSLMNPKVDEDATMGGVVQFRPSDDDRGADDRATGDSPAGDSEDVLGRADGLPAHKATSPPQDLADLRTHAQKRHDAFASIVMVAAACDGMPMLGGAAPTLVISVRAEDYARRTGRAAVEGAGYDVPRGAADHAACGGGVQRVLFDENGAIVAISTSARIFNARQRRAITLRDRKCVIPGCEIRADWCEIHREHGSGPVLMAGLTPRFIDAGSGMMGSPVLLAVV